MPEPDWMPYAAIIEPLHPDDPPSEDDKLPVVVVVRPGHVFGCTYNVREWSPLREESLAGLQAHLRTAIITRIQAAREAQTWDRPRTAGLEFAEYLVPWPPVRSDEE